MIYYFDSSALVKLYVSEIGSDWVRHAVDPGAGHVVYLAQIGVVEIAAALSKKVRTRELSEEDYETALLLFLVDVQNENYIFSPLSEQVVELAVDLTKQHPLRGYDAVHLATASVLHNALQRAKLPPLNFVSSDKNLCKAAQSEKFVTVIPGETKDR